MTASRHEIKMVLLQMLGLDLGSGGADKIQVRQARKL